LQNFSDIEAPKLLSEAIDWMNTDLLNIRDTIVADLNQVKYLFSFKK